MHPSGYTTREVAGLIGLPEGRVRTFVRERFLAPRRGPRGELRFSFQDLVLLRAAKGLTTASIPPARVRRALRKLKDQLPHDRPLSGVSIAAEGDRIVVHDGQSRWNPESGQVLFDFRISELVDRVAPLIGRGESGAAPGPTGAEAWYAAGCMLEAADPDRAIASYRRALELDQEHADAHINLGRLLQQRSHPSAAEKHYREALSTRPADATAWFNLGTLLEDARRWQESADAYSRAIASDPSSADAYFNLSRLCERAGRKADAIRLLKTYRQLARG